MPSAVARTATLALTHATLPYVLRLTNQGVNEALKLEPGLRAGLQVYAGQLTHRGLAEDLGRPWTPYEAIAAGLHST
jgi:alanine dehydrogenase